MVGNSKLVSLGFFGFLYAESKKVETLAKQGETSFLCTRKINKLLFSRTETQSILSLLFCVTQNNEKQSFTWFCV